MIASRSATAIVAAPTGWEITGPVLEVTLANETYPGLNIVEPIDDWRGYSYLDVELFVRGSTSMPITLSIRFDASVPHVYREFECAAGPCHLELKLPDLFDREVLRVSEVVIYSSNVAAGRSVYLGRVALRA